MTKVDLLIGGWVLIGPGINRYYLLIGANILGFAKGINEGGINRGVLIGY